MEYATGPLSDLTRKYCITSIYNIVICEFFALVLWTVTSSEGTLNFDAALCCVYRTMLWLKRYKDKDKDRIDRD